jgi:hypothetical protein
MSRCTDRSRLEKQESPKIVLSADRIFRDELRITSIFSALLVGLSVHFQPLEDVCRSGAAEGPILLLCSQAFAADADRFRMEPGSQAERLSFDFVGSHRETLWL